MDRNQDPFFQFFPGGTVREVDPVDLEAVLELCGGVQPGLEDRNKATGMDLFERICTPGADVQSVGYRALILQMCAHLNLLSPWMDSGILDKAVIRVAARFPMKRMEAGVVHNGPPFDFEEFMKQVEAATKK